MWPRVYTIRKDLDLVKTGKKSRLRGPCWRMITSSVLPLAIDGFSAHLRCSSIIACGSRPGDGYSQQRKQSEAEGSAREVLESRKEPFQLTG